MGGGNMGGTWRCNCRVCCTAPRPARVREKKNVTGLAAGDKTGPLAVSWLRLRKEWEGEGELGKRRGSGEVRCRDRIRRLQKTRFQPKAQIGSPGSRQASCSLAFLPPPSISYHTNNKKMLTLTARTIVRSGVCSSLPPALFENVC